MSEIPVTIMITATAAPAQATKEGSGTNNPPSNEVTTAQGITPLRKHPGLYVDYRGSQVHPLRCGYSSGVTVSLANKKS